MGVRSQAPDRPPSALPSASERPAVFAARDWSAYLTAELDCPVEVSFSRARKTPVVLVSSGSKSLVRMNAFFSEAPPEVRQALATWLRSGRRAKRAARTLDDWIEQRLALLLREEPRTVSIRQIGEAHDLAVLSEELRVEEFENEFDERSWPRITWGRSGRSRSRHSLRLGSYDYLSGIVRIHTVLDQVAVPNWFVRYVLFHELLHAALPCAEAKAGRRVFHGPAFKQRERAYHDTAHAHAWERRHLGSLIRSARSGKPFRTPALGNNAGSRPQRSSAADASARGWVQRLLFS